LVQSWKKSIDSFKVNIIFSLIGAFFYLLPFSVYSFQDPILLKNEKLSFTPTEYYFAEVLDERPDQSKIGMLLLPQSSGLQAVDLRGGTKASLTSFIFNSLNQDKKLRPIQVRIKESSITEKRGATGIVEGSVKLHFSFYYLGDEDPVHLVDYNGGVSYKRSASQSGLVEPALRRSLGTAIKYFHDWIEIEAPENVRLARGMNITFIDRNVNPDKDTVFYSSSRPLMFEDFRARPTPGSRFAASIFTSFSFDVESEIVGGILEVKVYSKVFMLKDQSWARAESKNEYTLNHEQRHFDITQIVVERLKDKLKNLEIYPDEYDSVINYYYLEAFREMNRLQDLYDKETRHGMDRGAQDRWNRRIDQALTTGDFTF